MNADGSGKERLTSAPSGKPVWPGRRWTEDRVHPRRAGGNSEIYVMNADGSEQRRLTSDAWGGELAWSPVGTRSRL